MFGRTCLIGALVFALLILSGGELFAQKYPAESHIKVALRMVGHRVLSSLGDSTSRVLPIVKKDHRYEIHFDTEFSFDPELLVSKVNKVIEETEIASNYIVEVEQCESRETVYSFEMNKTAQSDIVPCRARTLPEDCYVLLINLLDPFIFQASTDDLLVGVSDSWISEFFGPGLLALAVLMVLVFFWMRKRSGEKETLSLARIGKFTFDRVNAQLVNGSSSIVLSSKEADLLQVLYQKVNQTVKKEDILHQVWGDKGDYVGRTLDVFISKLRKKLEADQSLKIVNIRGVGYKLVENGVERS